jgi:hypothetical protein
MDSIDTDRKNSELTGLLERADLEQDGMRKLVEIVNRVLDGSGNYSSQVAALKDGDKVLLTDAAKA